jgi:repressor LexA
MTELTKAQRRVLDFSQAELQAGRPVPTLREIAERFGFAGYRAAAVDLEALKRKGFLETGSGKARALRIISPSQKLHSRIMDIPVFGSIPAGFAQDKEQAAKGSSRWLWKASASSRNGIHSRSAWANKSGRKW